jgi:hypothetical protein
MNGYICIYYEKRFEVKAKTSYEALTKALEHFNPPKSRRYQVSVHLAESYDKDGNVIPVVHTPDF